MLLCAVDNVQNLIYLIVTHVLLLGKERYERLQAAAKESVLHLLHGALGIFLASDERTEKKSFLPLLLLTAHKLLGGQNLQECGNGRVGRLWLWVLLNDGMGCAFLLPNWRSRGIWR